MIPDYNKRCADFLGWKNLNDDSFPEYVNNNGDFYSLKNLLFDSDWNWIMEVIDVIQKLDINKNKLSSHPYYYGFDLETNNYYAHFQFGEDLHFNGESKESQKEAVVQAITQFLIYYNKQ